MVKYEDGMLICDQNYIFCGHNVVNLLVESDMTTSIYNVSTRVLSVISPIESRDFLTAWVACNMTEPGSSVPEAGAVIKFRYFSTQYGYTRMLWT